MFLKVIMVGTPRRRSDVDLLHTLPIQHMPPLFNVLVSLVLELEVVAAKQSQAQSREHSHTLATDKDMHGDSYACSHTSSVRSGVWPSFMAGVSCPEVDVILSVLVLPSRYSHTQADPAHRQASRFLLAALGKHPTYQRHGLQVPRIAL